MQLLFQFIGQIWWWLWPVIIVRSYQRGVRFRLGIVREEALEPGWHIRWWWDEIVVVNVVPDVINLAFQSTMTSDRKSVVFSANVAYEIVDPVACYTQVQNFADNLADMALRHLAQRVRDQSFDELVDGQAELERSLKRTLETRVREWGVRILDVGFTEFVSARQYRLIQ